MRREQNGLVSTVKLQWRDHVDIGSSEVITATLTNPGTTDQLPCLVGGSAQGQVKHVGKQGVPLAMAFGSGYVGYANAGLDATGFNAMPASQDQESLNQQRIDWNWVISPKASDQQYVVISVSGTWQPCFGMSVIHRELWSSDPIAIAVDQPLLQRSSFDAVGFLTTTAGASSLLLVVLRFIWHLLQLLWAKVRPANQHDVGTTDGDPAPPVERPGNP